MLRRVYRSSSSPKRRTCIPNESAGEAHSTPIPSRLPHPSAPLPVTYSFRINTYKSVSKQRTLTPFRMNTYEKQGKGGSMAFLARSLISTASFAHQGGLACHAQPRPLFLHPRVGEAAPARVKI